VNCARFKELVSEALSGELSPEVLAEFNEHKESCKKCASEFAKHRRLRAYLQYFPTVAKVNDEFRRELIRRVKEGNFKPIYRVRLSSVLATFAVIGLMLFGVLFGIKLYLNYLAQEEFSIVQKEVFVARYSEPRSARAGGKQMQATGGTASSWQPGDTQAILILDLSQLTTENFVLRLLVKLERNEVPESLAQSLLVETGLLDGVRVRSSPRGVLDPITGKPRTVEVIFPKRLPSIIVTAIKGADVFALKNLALDLTSTFGIYIPRFASNGDLSPLSKVMKDSESAEIMDVTSLESGDERIKEDRTYSLVIFFTGDEGIAQRTGGN